jgi:hypothetical protein
VAIHTIASAAHEIIHSLFRAKGLKGLIFDSPIVRPEKRQLVSSKIKQPANFFKHARPGEAPSLEFDPELSFVLMVISCKGLRDMGEEPTVEEAALTFWALFSDPELFLAGKALLQNANVQAIKQLTADGPQVFLRDFEWAWSAGFVKPTDFEAGM